MEKATKTAPAAVEQWEERQTESTAPQSLLIRQGRGRLGGSTLLEYIVLRARQAQRAVIVGDGDVDHASLSETFPPGGPGGAIRPVSAQPDDLHHWVTDLVGQAVDEGASLVLDLGGGEAILRNYNRSTSLVGFCDEVGIQSVGLFMCGPDPADFNHIVGIWRSGHFRPRWSVLVLNEYLTSPGSSPVGAFNFILDRPEYAEMSKEGLLTFIMPRLVAMADMRNAGLTFRDAVDGKPGASGRPLGPMVRFQIRKWVDDMEQRLEKIGAGAWLP